MSKKNYKDTLSLPSTQMPMKANLPQREPDLLAYWQQEDIYRKLNKKTAGQDLYLLHDGPPYANGHIHMGHVLNKVLKDIVLKYKVMAGHHAPFVPGWDCHGLPVEHQLFKKLNLNKEQISVVEFRKKARDYALSFVDIQREEFKRLGVFADWDNPYLTLSRDYEATIIKTFSRLVEKGFIYRGLKPVNWCSRCQTALAEAEVEYQPHQSPSVYVKFKLDDKSKQRLLEEKGFEKLKSYQDYDINFIVWTTTPWTLLANIAVALSPGLEYDFVKVGNEVWVFADSLFDTLSENFADKNKFEKQDIILKTRADKLLYATCRHPFIERSSHIILADYVLAEEGTGCVHTAPGHGQEDYLSWLRYRDKIDNFDIIMPVDDRGVFTEEAGEFAGQHVHKADKGIIEKLKSANKLIKSEEIEHAYPHCWRCKEPIIFRATMQWFMKIGHNDFRKKLIEAVNSAAWIPSGGRERIEAMIENRPDWCLSRQRYWGVPVPVFYCQACQEPILDKDVIDTLADKVRAEGLDIWFEKSPRQLLPDGFSCPNCRAGSFYKEDDILDVWFDSGISHQAVLRERDELSFPADLYLEGSDQHRGWFQTSLITALAVENQAPYKSVLTHGFIVDAEGKKMSKSLGNVISPNDIIKTLGSDILRLWVASSDYHNDINLSEEILQRLSEAYRKIRNTLRFMVGNLYDYDPDEDDISYDELLEIDKWALDALKRLSDDCNRLYAEFQLHKIYHRLYNFCVVELSSFYLDVLKDRLYTWGKNSKGRRSAQYVLYRLTLMLLKLMAPVLSFTAEEVWRYLKGQDNTASIFEQDLRGLTGDDEWLKPEIRDAWTKLRGLRDVVLKALEEKRAAKLIGNSLEADIVLEVKAKKAYDFLKKYESGLADIFIVSSVDVKEAGDLSDKALVYEELPDVGIEVKKAESEKCPRCWRYVGVGSNEKYNDVCQRCADAIEQLS